MSNETRTGAPLGATVGERLEERAHEGDPTGVERAAALVDDLHAGGYEAPPSGGGARRAGEGEERSTPATSGAGHAGGARPPAARSPLVWGVAAGLGAWLVAGVVGRAFRR